MGPPSVFSGAASMPQIIRLQHYNMCVCECVCACIIQINYRARRTTITSLSCSAMEQTHYGCTYMYVSCAGTTWPRTHEKTHAPTHTYTYISVIDHDIEVNVKTAVIKCD